MPDLPWRDTSVTAASCPVCGQPPASPHARYCGRPCRQRAYRRRHAPDPAALDAVPPVPASVTSTSVYECAGCGERLTGTRRCPDCNLYARRIGTGGPCPSCGDPVTTEELLEATTT